MTASPSRPGQTSRHPGVKAMAQHRLITGAHVTRRLSAGYPLRQHLANLIGA